MRSVGALLLLLALAGTAAAAPPTEPSDRGCLLAWNAASNDANHAKLLRARPAGLMLHGGRSGTDTWTKTTTTSTSTAACLLTVVKARTSQLVVGPWNGGSVDHWSWSRAYPKPRFLAANVRLLADGRVTKIDGH